MQDTQTYKQSINQTFHVNSLQESTTIFHCLQPDTYYKALANTIWSILLVKTALLVKHILQSIFQVTSFSKSNSLVLEINNYKISDSQTFEIAKHESAKKFLENVVIKDTSTFGRL